MTSASLSWTPVAFDRVVVVHGLGATPDDHWFPWLADAVPSVERLRLADPLTPVADVWIPRVAEAIGSLDPRTAVVTHSLGGLTTLRALQTLTGHGPERLGALITVAPFAEPLPPSGNPDLDAFRVASLPAFLTGLDLSAAAATIDRTVVIRSDSDPLVPVAASDRFAAALAAPVRVCSGAGHFMATEGVTQVDDVVDALRADT